MHRAVLAAALLWYPSGCATDAPAAVDACQAAADHLADCSGQVAPAAPGCDAAQAESVLARSCTELGAELDDQKSDRWNDKLASFGCSLGLYRYCPEVSCEPVEDEGAGFVTLPRPAPEGASACATEALQWQGCGACEYYRCREEAAGCGPDGYLTRFALRYCERYRLIAEPHASPAARAFLERVRRCLVTTFDREVPDDDCGVMWQRGFDSHPECYLETGFCELSVSDWLLVLATVDRGDEDFKQMLTTGVLCLREWFGD